MSTTGTGRTGDERWIVRRDGRYRSRYYHGANFGDFMWGRWQRGAERMTRDEATASAMAHGGRAVRLLSRAESVERAERRGCLRGLREALRIMRQHAEAMMTRGTPEAIACERRVELLVAGDMVERRANETEAGGGVVRRGGGGERG